MDWTDQMGEAYLNWNPGEFSCQYSASGLGSDGSWRLNFSCNLGYAAAAQTNTTRDRFWQTAVAISFEPGGGIPQVTNSLYDTGDYGDSGIEFKIFPIGSGPGITTQKLWGPSENLSGTVTVKGVRYFGYDGMFDTSTGVPI
jgi:hypothetical protein